MASSRTDTKIDTLRRALCLGSLALATSARHSVAQSISTAAAPAPATPTEEVPYVQTPMHVVRRMLQLADVNSKDVVWDLGSGDGRIVIEAAKLGARGVGYEIDPSLVRESVQRARRERVAARAKFVVQDIFTLDFREPTVITMYLLPEFNVKLRPLLLSQMKPGSRIVSHEWDMGDWQADETLVYPSPAKPHGTNKEHRVMLWVVPANVAGRWRITRAGKTPFVIDVSQQYQKLAVQSSDVAVNWALLRGRSVRFAFRDGAMRDELEGMVSADQRSIQGRNWQADRLS
jgi:SAM-dependent methyltransferase